MQKQHHNMKQTILILFFSLIVLTSFGQTWQNVGSGVNDNIYDLIKFDNKLYAGGRIGVKYWDGATWTGLPNPFGIAYPLTLAVYNDTLYVGGDFPWSGSISHVYKYNGTSWVQVGGDFDEAFWSSTKRLLTFNGQLISGGHYTSINGNTIYNISSWNGNTWNALGNGLNGGVWNLAEHNGQLLASGDFTASGTNTTVYRIAKWDGLNWSPIDTTHRFNSAGPMISYNGNLIIGNVWDTISGIQMKGVVKWTGSNFVSMGNNLIKSVSNFWTLNSELFLSGKIYNFNPNDDDDVVLKWNGFFWEQVGQVFNQPVLTLDDFNNEVFCGGFYTSPTSYISNLNTTTGIYELNGHIAFQIYPNPAIDNIIFTTTDNGILTITNQLGQVISTFKIREKQTFIETSNLNAGIYFLSFQSDKGHTTSKLIKQ
jgi:Secretion system C-terminal sorting domain